MQLIEPDILAEASGLSVGISACGLLLGLAVWLTGWRRHRFWVVLTITLVARMLYDKGIADYVANLESR